MVVQMNCIENGVMGIHDGRSTFRSMVLHDVYTTSNWESLGEFSVS